MRFARYLADPLDHTPVRDIDTAHGGITFESGRRYRVHDGIPLLVPDASIFVVDDIAAGKTTTQVAQYHSDARLKNRVRRQVLPALSMDRGLGARYRSVSAATSGSAALVLGAGDKVTSYRHWLADNEVLTSDVHLEFVPDLVCDAHWIPCGDGALGLVVAGQVLEHTLRPWRVAEEMERVVHQGGLVQVEVPFAFPLHSEPWDFFRFTVGGLRSLFRASHLVRIDVAEGNFSGAATIGASALTSCFRGRYPRMAALLAGRLAFGWLKYLDGVNASGSAALSSPQGIAATFRVDKRVRPDDELLEDVRAVLHEGPGHDR